MTEVYSVLALDQSMTSTGWAHYLKGDKAPTGGLFSLPSWGEDQGRHLDAFYRWLYNKVWDLHVTHLAFEEPVLPQGLDYREGFGNLLAKYGLPAVIEMVGNNQGIPPDHRLLVNQSSWRTRFWGKDRPLKGLTKQARTNWLKERSLQACDERGWLVAPRKHHIADAMGVLNEALCCIDQRWAANATPLFNRAQLRIENEERELR